MRGRRYERRARNRDPKRATRLDVSQRLPQLHAKPTSVLALGDTPYDAESAGKAGIRTIGVTTGGWSRQELLDAGCIEVYQDVAELLDRFDQSALMHYGPVAHT